MYSVIIFLLTILWSCSSSNPVPDAFILTDMGSASEPIMITYQPGYLSQMMNQTVGTGSSYYCVSNLTPSETYEIELKYVSHELAVTFFIDQFVTPICTGSAAVDTDSPYLIAANGSGKIYFQISLQSAGESGAGFYFDLEPKTLYSSEGTIAVPFELNFMTLNELSASGKVGPSSQSYYVIRLPIGSSVEIMIQPGQEYVLGDLTLYTDSGFTSVAGTAKHRSHYSYWYSGVASHSSNSLYMRIDDGGTRWGNHYYIGVVKLFPEGSAQSPVKLDGNYYQAKVTKADKSYYYLNTDIGSTVNISVDSYIDAEGLRLIVFGDDNTFTTSIGTGSWDGQKVNYTIHNYSYPKLYFCVDGGNTAFGALFYILLE